MTRPEHYVRLTSVRQRLESLKSQLRITLNVLSQAENAAEKAGSKVDSAKVTHLHLVYITGLGTLNYPELLEVLVSVDIEID